MRALWILGGLVLTGFGFVGYVVPGMPGTVFLLGALYCFSRSSPRMERWLLEHPWFGPMLRDWRRYRGIRRALKGRIVAIIALACGVSCAILLWRDRPVWIAAAVVALGAVGIGVVLCVPEPPEGLESESS